MFDEVLPKHFHSCNFDMVRKESLLCPAVSGVGVGAMLSPAAVNDHIDKDRPDSEPIHNRCIWGCGCLGDFHHIAWECQHRPLKFVPSGSIDARYGWMKRSSLRWLGQVQKKIWELRHGKDPP